MLGPELVPTMASRNEFITCPIGYSFCAIHSNTIFSVFSFEKSSIPASSVRSAAIRVGFSPFQNLAVDLGSYCSGATNMNEVRFQKSLTNVARCLISAITRAVLAAGASTPFAFRIGAYSAASSASDLACRYWALNQCAFSGLNRAPLLLTRSSEKAPISSSIEKISWSVPGFQPSSASMLTNASGKYPSSR